MKTSLLRVSLALILALGWASTAEAAGWCGWCCDKDTQVADAGPSMWERMSNGTRSFFGRARNTFSFGHDDASPQPVGWSQSQRQTAKRGWFGSWFQPAEPPLPETMDEWLSLDRPE